MVQRMHSGWYIILGALCHLHPVNGTNPPNKRQVRSQVLEKKVLQLEEQLLQVPNHNLFTVPYTAAEYRHGLFTMPCHIGAALFHVCVRTPIHLLFLVNAM
jgi:hypothetical protein